MKPTPHPAVAALSFTGDLFDEPLQDSLVTQSHIAVDGLKYVPKFVSASDESALLAAVDTEPWLSDLKRKVKHYGYRYDYKTRKVDPSMYLGSLPKWIRPLAARLVSEGHMNTAPDQMIVNEYLPGQGISSHMDCVPCFGPVLCSLSLGSHCMINLARVENGEKLSLLLEPRSLLVLSGDARYKWRHAIPARKTDKFSGQVFRRGRRVSLTFRTVI